MKKSFDLFLFQIFKKMAKKVTLKSQDQQELEIDIDVIKQSKIVSQMMEDLPDDGEFTEALPIANVNSAILKKVVEWCQLGNKISQFTAELISRTFGILTDRNIKTMRQRRIAPIAPTTATIPCQSGTPNS